MRVSPSRALRITVAYGDIFNYPLTEEETRFWTVFRQLPKRYAWKISKRRALILLRKRREKYSQQKWTAARRVAHWLRIIPTIELIGVTGALAMDNTDREDDIDFFIVTKPSTLWITRLLITLFLDLFSLRRRPRDLVYKDKICLNMFLTSNALAVSKSERDLFTAHEVLQMKPLWDRDETYQKFLRANSWVEKFLPTAWKERYQVSSIKYQETSSLLRFLEPMAKTVQLWYMRKRRTTEIVSDTIIRFHPVDAREWIYRALQTKLRHTKIPLDKIFYGR